MRKSSIILLVFISFMGMAIINKPLSSGAPSASTGAPDEQSCAMSTCHDDHGLNEGLANLKIEIPENASPGEIIPIKIYMTDPGKVRFGFQVTALNDKNQKVGQFLLQDSTRTQIIGGKSSLPDREYLTYTYYGTLGSKAGESVWEANWKVPETIENINFYAAGVSANNDGEDGGDYVYTTSKKLTLSNTSSISKTLNNNMFYVFANAHTIQVKNQNHRLIQQINVVDLSGKTLMTKTIHSDDKNISLDLPKTFSGIVMVSIISYGGKQTSKLFIHD